MPSPASDRAPVSVRDQPVTDVPAEDAAGSWHIELPAVPESIDGIQDLVGLMYDSVVDDLTATDRIRFETAVVEVVGNVIEHATSRQAGTPVVLRVRVSREGNDLLAVIDDDAVVVDVDLSAASMGTFEDIDGRGLAMALALSSELRHERRPDGNRWVVSCACS